MAKNKKETANVSQDENVVLQVPVELDIPEVSIPEHTMNSTDKATRLFRYYSDMKRNAYVGDVPKTSNIVYTILAEFDPVTFKWIFDGDDVKRFLGLFDIKMDCIIDEYIEKRNEVKNLFN